MRTGRFSGRLGGQTPPWTDIPWADNSVPLHAGINTSRRRTDICENITFPQLLLRAIKMKLLNLKPCLRSGAKKLWGRLSLTILYVRAHLHQASASTLRELCDDASKSVLSENSGVTWKWVATVFLSDSIVFNENRTTIVIAELLETWRWR